MGEGVSSACKEHLRNSQIVETLLNPGPNCLASFFSCFLYNSCLMNESVKSITWPSMHKSGFAYPFQIIQVYQLVSSITGKKLKERGKLYE